MLFPEDPKKRPALWGSLAERLSADRYCYVVEQCVGNPAAEAVVRSADEVAATLARLRAANICRISASRGIAAAPHFGLQMVSPEQATLCEMVTFPSDGSAVALTERLRRDLETMAVSVLYDYPDIRELVVPVNIEPWQMADAKVIRTEQGLQITR